MPLTNRKCTCEVVNSVLLEHVVDHGEHLPHVVGHLAAGQAVDQRQHLLVEICAHHSCITRILSWQQTLVVSGETALWSLYQFALDIHSQTKRDVFIYYFYFTLQQHFTLLNRKILMKHTRAHKPTHPVTHTHTLSQTSQKTILPMMFCCSIMPMTLSTIPSSCRRICTNNK